MLTCKIISLNGLNLGKSGNHMYKGLLILMVR